MIDTYLLGWPCVVIGTVECITLVWIYGGEKWSKDIESMERKKPSVIWILLWKFGTPLVLVFVGMLSLVDFVPPSYNGLQIPVVLIAIVWSGLAVLILLIPVTIILDFLTQRPRLGVTATKEEESDQETRESEVEHHKLLIQIRKCGLRLKL